MGCVKRLDGRQAPIRIIKKLARTGVSRPDSSQGAFRHLQQGQGELLGPAPAPIHQEKSLVGIFLGEFRSLVPKQHIVGQVGGLFPGVLDDPDGRVFAQRPDGAAFLSLPAVPEDQGFGVIGWKIWCRSLPASLDQVRICWPVFGRCCGYGGMGPGFRQTQIWLVHLRLGGPGSGRLIHGQGVS